MSMFNIEDGRNYLYQWDTGRQLNIETQDDDISAVDFSYTLSGECITKEATYDSVLRKYIVNIPDEILRNYGLLRIYAYGDYHTKYFWQIEVRQRAKPADYIDEDIPDSFNARLVELENSLNNAESDIERAQDDILSIQGNVSDLSPIVTDLKTDVETLSPIVTDLKTDVDTLGSEVQSLSNDITALCNSLRRINEGNIND